MSATNPKFIFVHIFKCAGTLFLGGIRYSYPDPKHLLNYSAVPRGETRTLKERAQEAEVLHGHCYYGVHKEIDWDAIYMTVLRDPIDRILSSYYYLQEDRCAGHPLHKMVNTYSLEECLEPWKIKELEEPARSFSMMEFRNRQTRMMYGHPKLTGYTGEEVEDWRNLELNEDHLKQATANLNTCSFVGLTDRTDHYWELLHQRFGFAVPDPQWKSENPHFSNKTKSRPSSLEISDELKSKIVEANRLDTQLYVWGVRHHDQINSRGLTVVS